MVLIALAIVFAGIGLVSMGGGDDTATASATTATTSSVEASA